MQWANEQNQKEYFARILAAGMPIDYWWMDADGIHLPDGWWNTGTWDHRSAAIPHGLRR